MTKRHLVIATRNSPLALVQAELVKQLLLSHYPHLTCDLLGITTEADKKLMVAVSAMGGKGSFVKELEEALLDRRADIAVHSMKDMPMRLPSELCLPVISKRADPRDVFVANDYRSFDALPQNAIVGTSSLRRQTQLRALRSDVIVKPLRGNIQTRLRRLDEGDFDAIILAGAGLIRMNLQNRIASYFDCESLLPSGGQGALGIECRADDQSVQQLIAPLNHRESAACVLAERAVCEALGGGCSSPLAVFAAIHHRVMTVQGVVANLLGTRRLHSEISGDPEQAVHLGIALARALKEKGAEKILAECMPHTGGLGWRDQS